jgi:hypothetical protein
MVIYNVMATYIQTLQNSQSAYGKPFDRLINDTLAFSPQAPYLALLNISVQTWNAISNAPCLDWKPHFDAIDPYIYLQCTYLPQIDGYTASNSIWGLNSPSIFLDPTKGDKALLDPWRKAAFNMSSVQGGAAYQASLGLDQTTLQKTSRLLLTGGLFDPVTAAGTPPWYPGQHSMDDSRVYLVQGGAHTSDIIAENVTDSDGLKEARVAYSNIMKAWLAETGP